MRLLFYKDHIAYASKYEFVIRKKLEAISNRVATNRLGFYGYTTTGMIQNVKKKLMQKVKDEAAHELRARLERAIIFVKTVTAAHYMFMVPKEPVVN